MTPNAFHLSNQIDPKTLAPFGNSDFSTLLRAHNANPELPFIDKTKMIESVFAHQDSIILFTRPRRFGKSTNISMLHYFLGIPEARSLFEPLAIGHNRQIMDEYQGAYSVISLSLKDFSGALYSNWIEEWKILISSLFSTFKIMLHDYLHDPLHSDNADFFYKMTTKNAEAATEEDLKTSLKNLSQYLTDAFNKPVWILIDEYDAPLHHAYEKKYYSEAIAFMRAFLGKALKDNSYLHRGILTGILRLAKESLFSSLNNLVVDSIFNKDYAPYFGFTPEEVQLLLAQKGIISSSDPIPEDIVKWYNGYKAGQVTLYNPWSILCYLKHKEFNSYWVNTGSDLLIRDLLRDTSYGFPEKLKQLLLGETIEERVSENLEMTTINSDLSALWSLLIFSGYLKIISTPVDLKKRQILAIPNLEVYEALKQVGMSVFNSPTLGFGWLSDDLYDLLQKGKTEKFFAGLKRILQENASYHDLGANSENFYHGLLLGIISSIQNSHRVLSNRESGHGRYDLAVIPKENFQLNPDYKTRFHNYKIRVLLFEIKRVSWIKGRTEEQMELLLEETAQKALDQIEEKDYLSEFRHTVAEEVIAIGIAFCGKLFYGQERVYPLT